MFFKTVTMRKLTFTDEEIRILIEAKSIFRKLYEEDCCDTIYNLITDGICDFADMSIAIDRLINDDIAITEEE